MYPEFPPDADAVLITSSESDCTIQEILHIVFHAFSALLGRLLSDHLAGGIHDTVNPVTLANINVNEYNDYFFSVKIKNAS